MANPDDEGQTELVADTDGEVTKARIDGGHLAQALKACDDMVELKLTDGKSPVLFTSNGYKLVVMPMLTSESRDTVKPEASQAETERQVEAEPEEAEKASAVAEAEAVAKSTKPKPKRKSKAKEPVAVA